MASEMRSYYRLKGGLNIELIHCVNNKFAAEKAMLNAFRRTKSDIASSGGSPTPGVAYTPFDGRNCH